MGQGTRCTDLVRALAGGPFFPLTERIRVHVDEGRLHEALTEIDELEWIAEAFADRTTVDILIQWRMYTYGELQQLDPALAAGLHLVARHRAAGNPTGEARTLADLAELCLLNGQVTEGMRYLARAGLLLENTTRRDIWYAYALLSYGEAAMAAGLYETAATYYDEYLRRSADTDGYVQSVYAGLLVSWGLWLECLGRDFEAGYRWRRLAVVTGDWLTAFGAAAVVVDVQVVTGAYALALAKLGRTEEALALAQPVVTAMRTGSYVFPELWMGHLGLAVAFGDLGDHAAARREVLAAEHLLTSGVRADDRLLVQRELAVRNAETLGPQACADMLTALQQQAQQLWHQRRQRVTMLHQARQREELEIEHAHTHAALLRDPLTGLGNRRRFDQLMAEVHAGAAPLPLSLLIIDVDKFKTINDTHSHSAGDEVLRELGAIIGPHCRAGLDTPIRYAGDEFTIFLNADLAGAVNVAERIHAKVAATDFDHITPGTPVSISTGVAALRAGMTAQDLFHAADTNLYEAKRGGRNRVAA